MRKITFFLSALLAFAGATTAGAQIYVPTERVSALENGGTYMLYNTAFNGTQCRTGFLSNNGSSLGHSGSAARLPESFGGRSNFLWKIETTETPSLYYMQSVSSGTYVGPAGVTNNTDKRNLYIQPWATSQAPKAEVGSEKADGTVISYSEDAVYDNVFTICGTSVQSNQQANGNGDCWNGNQNGWAKWASSHPYAFYKVKEVVTADQIDLLDAAKTTAENAVWSLQNVYGLVTDASKYTSNAKESSEGSYEGLLDGNYTTFFHSSYSQAIDADHYLQAELPDLTSDIRFFFKRRSHNNNNRPTEIDVYGSVNGEEESFTFIQTITDGLPTQENTIGFGSGNIHSDTPYKYFRFVVKKTNNGATNGTHVFFTFSEFYVLPGNNKVIEDILTAYNAIYTLAPTDRDFINNVEKLDGVVKQVNDAYAELDKLTRTVTIEHLFDGQLAATTTTEGLLGKNITIAPEFSRYGLTCNDTEKTVLVGENTKVTFNYTWNTTEKPFETSTVANSDFNDTDSSVKWYYLTQRNKYSRYDATDNKIKSGSTERDYLLYKDLFAFEGNPITGYKIYNYAAGANKVLGGPVSNNAHVTMMEDAEGTERFVLENNEDEDGAFHLVFRKDNTTDGYLNDVTGAIGYWTAASLARVDGGSTFVFVPVSDDAFNKIPDNETKSVAKDAFEAALAIAKTYSNHIGTGYNQYSQQSDDTNFATAVTDAEAFKSAFNAETTTAEEMNEWAGKLTTLVEHLTFNMPTAKSFIRIRCANGNRRLLSETHTSTDDKNGRLKLANTVEPNSIFYYDNNRLLAYQTGLYVNEMVYAPVGGNGATVELTDGKQIQMGTYILKCGTRYLYGADDVLDSGSGVDNRNGYTWWLEAVNALPVSIGDSKFATLWTPVALNVPEYVTAYTATINGDVLELEEVEGVIPAETGVVINGEEGSYNFNIAPETPESIEKGSLTGTVNTITTPTNTLTLQQVSDAKVGFKMYNGETVSGFKARLETDGTQHTLRMVFGGTATGIDGVAAADGQNAGAIYDMSGRRVAKPAKGLYIVNGQKVLFK